MVCCCFLCKLLCGSSKIVVQQEHDGWEEKCLPSFWHDNGVPPVPVLSWVFDPANRYFNDNRFMRWFGAIGYRYCDARRKEFMGMALVLTVVAIVVGVWGAVSLSRNPDTVRLTAWGTAFVTDPVGDSAVKFYIGLTKLVVDSCTRASGDDTSRWDCITTAATSWKRVDQELVEEAGLPWAETSECKEQMLGNQLAALSTTVTLIFALNGCLTRMRRRADSNFQKLLGTVPDTYGAVSLSLTLIDFFNACYADMPRELRGEPLVFTPGPAFVAYSLVWLLGVGRCLLSWLTPIPGKGCNNECCLVQDHVNTNKMKNKVQAAMLLRHGSSAKSLRRIQSSVGQDPDTEEGGESPVTASAAPPVQKRPAGPWALPPRAAVACAAPPSSSPQDDATLGRIAEEMPSAAMSLFQLALTPTGQLPPGWVQAFSATHQRRYFYHVSSKTTTWLQPFGEQTTAHQSTAHQPAAQPMVQPSRLQPMDARPRPLFDAAPRDAGPLRSGVVVLPPISRQGGTRQGGTHEGANAIRPLRDASSRQSFSLGAGPPATPGDRPDGVDGAAEGPMWERARHPWQPQQTRPDGASERRASAPVSRNEHAASLQFGLFG